MGTIIERLKALKDLDVPDIKEKISALGPQDPESKAEFNKVFWEAVIIGLKMFIKYGSKSL